jgi:uncharacterized protein (DUF849 family)
MSPALSPAILTVAPNGARRVKVDHPVIPLTADELATDAATCQAAGAAMIHAHVRRPDGRHLLDADAYRQATDAIRRQVGPGMVVQITTEAAGLYQPPEQMRVVREVAPEAVSLAIRELVPDAAHEVEASGFFAWMRQRDIMLQIILYSPDDLARYHDLKARGVLGEGVDFLLFVLGRYTAGQQSRAADLLPFLEGLDNLPPWAVCAFGAQEAACAQAALSLGGHARVGFENNLHLPDGSLAPHNAALVATAAQAVALTGRRLANGDDVRAMHRG